jgi:hypothetical protein
MNRAWVTSLTIAGVVGTGGAAMAGLTDSGTAPLDPAPAALIAAAVIGDTTSTTAPSASVITYQVGPAGTITISYSATGATVTEATPAAGWTVTGASAVGNHVEILFTDAAQTVTFGADLVNGELVPAVSSMPVAGAPTPAPIAVTVIGSSSTPTGTQPTLPAPAVAPTVAPTMPAAPPSSSSSYDDDNDDDTITTAVPATAPSASATTSPSGAGHEDDDEYEDHDDDHDDEGDDD